MNSFEIIGNAQLIAHEGQRQIAAALGRVIARQLGRLVKVLERCLPQGTMAPW